MANGHGGARRGAGRPFGRRDRYPRFNNKESRKLQEEAAYLYGDYLFTNKEKLYTGTALEFNQLVYKSEQIHLKYRLYAANKVAEYEQRLAEAGIAIDSVTGISYETRLLDEIARLRKEEIAEKDVQLRKLVEDGVISAEAAKTVWQLWIEDSEADWQFSPTAILKLPRPPEPERTHSPPNVEENCGADGVEPVPSTSSSTNGSLKAALVEEVPKLWKQVVMDKATRVVFADPGVAFKIGDRRYQANSLGEIEVSDFLDEAALLRIGCRETR